MPLLLGHHSYSIRSCIAKINGTEEFALWGTLFLNLKIFSMDVIHMVDNNLKMKC